MTIMVDWETNLSKIYLGGNIMVTIRIETNNIQLSANAKACVYASLVTISPMFRRNKKLGISLRKNIIDQKCMGKAQTRKTNNNSWFLGTRLYNEIIEKSIG